MNETTHIVDSEGEVIIVSICLDCPFATWNKGNTEEDLPKPLAAERKLGALSDATRPRNRPPMARPSEPVLAHSVHNSA